MPFVFVIIDDVEKLIVFKCGCSSMVEHQPSKLDTWVRFPSPAFVVFKRRYRMVLLVGINAKYIHTTLSIRSLKANAGKYRKDVEIAEYTINHRREEILQGIYEKKPDAIGFSCYLWNIEYIRALVCDLKKILPHVFLFLGGPEVSYHPEKVLRENPDVDLVMVGEGEKTFREFMETKDFSKIEGIVYRKGEHIYKTALRTGMDINELVFPYDDMDGLENRIIYYESMRGCPFSCSYCLSSVEKTVRIKRPEKTEKEIDFFLRNKVRQIKFVDRTFNCSHEYAYRIWKYIGEHDNGITNFHFEIGGDLLQEEDFLLFSSFRPGLIQFEIGVQSTNPATIRAIRRTMDLEKLRENIFRIQSGRNIHQHLDLIAGLPYENFESFQHSFNDVYAMKPDQLQLGFLKVLDGSYMSEVQQQYDVLASSMPPYEVFSTKWISYDEVLLLKQIEEMVEVYYNSFQFSASVAYLGGWFETPFSLYRELAGYYQEHELKGRKFSRMERYEILWEFGKRKITEEEWESWREILTYDLFRRDYVKNPPDFVYPRTEEQKQKIRQFFDRECEMPHYLKGYESYVTRQLMNMIYVGEYTVDVEALLQSGQVCRREPYYILFDYRRRNPLDYGAGECRLSEREITGLV